MILIIDNKSKFIKTLEAYFDKEHIDYKAHKGQEKIDLESLENVDGLILSGGSGGPYNPKLKSEFSLLSEVGDVPIIGFCLGMEIISLFFGGKVDRLPKRQMSMEEIFIDKKEDPIFYNLPTKIFLKEKHYNYVSEIPKDFDVLAHSDVCAVEIMKHKNKPIYGFQSHPELMGEHGKQILINFLKMCGVA